MALSTTYLPAWLQRAMSASCPTRVDFPESGYVSVFPNQGRYASNIQDWVALSVLPGDMAEFTPLPDGLPGNDGQRLIDLQWALLLQRLEELQRPPQQYPFHFNLVYLVSWPSLPHLPQEIQPAMARLCALLARKPSAVSLLPLLLELPQAQVFMLIEALRLCGHVQVASTGAGPDSAAPSSGPLPDAAPQVQPAAPSLIAKIWQRLVAGG